METISKNLKKLGKQIGDGSQRDSSLQLLDKIQNAVKRARTFTPAKAEKIPEAERPQFVADFQKKLDELLVQFEKISGALRDGNTDEAQTLFAGLKQIKRDGHEKFTVEEED
jgi:soluble cytochrome b562